MSSRLRRYKSPRRHIYDFKNVDFEALCGAIRDSSLLTDCADNEDIDTAWDGWSRTLIELIDNHAPKIKARVGNTPP